MSDNYRICEKCRCRFAVGNVPAAICDMCDERERADAHARSLLRKADAELATLRQQLAALARECEAWRAAYDNQDIEIKATGNWGYLTEEDKRSMDKVKACITATDALIPSITTIAGGST